MKEVKTPKKPLIYYYGIVLLILLLFNLLVMPAIRQGEIVEVDYGTFVSMVDDGQISEAQLDENENVIYFIQEDDSVEYIYKTAMVGDQELTQRLLDAGVKFYGTEIQEESSWLSVVLSWLIPIIISLLWAVYGQKTARPGRRWRSLDDVWRGQEQRQDVRQVLRGHQIFRCGWRG